MAKNTGVAAMAERAIAPTVNELGYTLWDVEYVREGAEQYLRVTIDSDNGININDCERVHRAIMGLLEEYEWDHLEVSSPGIERTLKRASHFEKALGERVEVRLYSPDENGKKSYVGTLKSADDSSLTLDTDAGEITFPHEKISKAKTICDFDQYN